jgi:hypothetical protein
MRQMNCTTRATKTCQQFKRAQLMLTDALLDAVKCHQSVLQTLAYCLLLALNAHPRKCALKVSELE